MQTPNSGLLRTHENPGQNRLYGKSASLRCGGQLFHNLGVGDDDTCTVLTAIFKETLGQPVPP